MTQSDTEARRRIREDLDATLFVEAAAGTGKTTELVARIVALLESGRATLEQIVAVTFTEKAAGEMKLRLRAEIERARERDGLSPSERAFLDGALGQLEIAHIGTIHGFCADLLRERPVEAGVDPLFEVAPEDEQRELLDGAFDAWFQRTLADPPEGVRRVLRRRTRGPNAVGPRASLRAAAEKLLEHRDFTAAWKRTPFDRTAEIDRVMDRLATLAPLAEQASKRDSYLARSFRELKGFVDDSAHREAVRGRDYDGLEAELRQFLRARHWRWKGSGKWFGKGLERDDVLAQRDAVRADIVALLERAEAELASHLREELRPLVATYESLKERMGKLDFLDLLLRARDLVRDDRAVREQLQSRFSHFFVDEFQDTDPLQTELLMLLAADEPGETDWRQVRPLPGKLFLVGDPKQSIYRFRRADVEIYESVKQRLSQHGAAVLHLTRSFRSVPSLQSAVNASFEPVMSGAESGSQARYVALEPFRPETQGQPSVVALPVPRPYGDYRTIVRWKIEESFPDAVGAFVDWLIHESGWTVAERDRPDEHVPIRARHVCLLFRRFRRFRDDMTRPYVRALEVRRVPHVLVGGRSFHDREEVLAIRNALCAIEWPEDELRVFASLRGPLFALGDAALLAFRHRVGRLHPLRRLNPDSLEDSDRAVGEALDVLGRLHIGRNHRPVAETLVRLLEAVRAHAGIAIWPTGEQSLANCLRMVDLARRFERGGASSFRAFVERMEDDAERGESQEAPAVEEGTEGVRIMTVHKAKGLEFPVVILTDPTCNATMDVQTRHVDAEKGLWAEPLCGCVPQDLLDAREQEARRDREEAVRLSYVAATRARDLLVLPVIGDPTNAEGEGWLDVMNPAIFPEPEQRRAATAAEGCPEFGADSVFERPDNVDRGPKGSIAPGSHQPQAGSHRVVWWDPAVLELDQEQSVGLRQERILEADEGDIAADEGIRAHERWQAARKEALERGAEPLLRVEPVTSLAEPNEDGSCVELAEVTSDRDSRPSGRRFGTLVHATLAAVDLQADASAVHQTVQAQGRLVGASSDELAAAAIAVEAALTHPLLRRAALAKGRGELRRETPVMLLQQNGTLAEGVVDLAFREESRWIVVDFKTDRELEPRRREYEAQVRLYVAAVAQATGEPAEGCLLLI